MIHGDVFDFPRVNLHITCYQPWHGIAIAIAISCCVVAIRRCSPLSGGEKTKLGACCFFLGKVRYPLVNCHIANWKDPPFFMGKSTISMAIFNCYVSSPEGIVYWVSGL